MELAAFATKAEVDVRADHLDMAVSQGGQSERAVLLSILLVADADSGLLEEPDDRGQHLLQRHAGPFQIAVGVLADLWQGGGEGQHPVVLDRVADLAPARVIAILLAPPSITPGRLEMARGSGQIQTSVHAGGMARPLIRLTVSKLRIALPLLAL